MEKLLATVAEARAPDVRHAGDERGRDARSDRRTTNLTRAAFDRYA